MRQAFTHPLAEIAGYEDLNKQIAAGGGIVEVSGCLDSQKAHLAAGLSDAYPVTLIVAENELKARAFYEDYGLFDEDVLYYPRRDLIFYQADLAGNLLTKQRMRVFQALIEQKNVSIVTSAGGIMDHLLPVRVLKNSRITVDSTSQIDTTALAGKLAGLGYERVGQVEASGQFSIRGDIIDIFSLTEDMPWRIELWGDEVDAIKSFDPETQRSVENLGSVTIYPATEEIGRESTEVFGLDAKAAKRDAGYFRSLTDTFLDYLPAESIVFLDEPARLMENAGAISDEFQEAIRHRLEEHKTIPEAADQMITDTQLAYLLNKSRCVALSLMEQRHLQLEFTGRYAVTARSVNSYNGQFASLVKDLNSYKKKGYQVILLSASRTRGARLAEELLAEGLTAFYSEEEDRAVQKGEILVTKGNIRRGFEYPLQKFVVITETDIFGGEKKKKRKKKAAEHSGDRIRSFSELSYGDYVVHENHGLGIYRGIEKVTVDNVTKDYIKIEYAGGSNLYVLATQLDLLQKYGSSEGRKPKINRLGGKDWGNTKSRVRGAVANIAKDLVELYAARADADGYRYGADTVWQREFEEMFPFEETEDQLQAIEDTKRDMESSKVMDRLICGDVGYGKTEIAIRAAFKAVQESKQVVVLCPTTILAQQHYNTFTQRMKNYPVNIEVMSRFRSAKQQKETVADVKKGKVDILIGTHRVLSKDVKFKDLGLLIVDEEQRFGVTHKEKIKQMKQNVDVLTLTATPIPRTLHMSLIGIRDMSVLEEPPLDRMPIQTYVMEYDEEMIREAVSREIARDGQVFLVHNRVKGIQDMAERIHQLVPEANVAYAHGQMKETELERIMYDFVNQDIDVLVSTTIIETGMDISNVNTIIIIDADQLGLSQLYQLRGRVGRSNRNAFAFLMYRRNKMLKEEAEKRLHAIREFTELGSGVKIAMRDLEIRGAGNLLGAEQSGHMEAVGYDLYCKMLNEAVRDAKGVKRMDDFETAIDLTVNAFIPASYIADESGKLDIYKRIAAIADREEADDMTDELTDRFGEPPASVMNLIQVSLLKAAAHQVFVTEIKQNDVEIRISLYEKARLDAAKIPELLNLEKYRNKLQFKAAGTPGFTYVLKKAAERKPENLMQALQELAEDMRILLEPGEEEN